MEDATGKANGICYHKVADTLRTSVFEQIILAKEMLGVSDKWEFIVNTMEARYIKTGQRILFRGMDKARKLVNQLVDKNSFNDLKQLLLSSTDSKAKKELLKVLEGPAYAARIKRLEDVQQTIDKTINQLGGAETVKSRKHYKKLADDTYYKSVYDLQSHSGYAFSFSSLKPSTIDRIIKSKWLGGNYSSRIWDNTQDLADRVKTEVLVNFLTGRTDQEAAQAIAEAFGGGFSKAHRLVRTESAHVVGEMDKVFYDEIDADEYYFVATLDGKTSEICRELDMQKFKVKDAKEGVNYPPMHPWCRSRSIENLGDKVMSRLKRTARDPETGKNYKVPATMSYKEWRNGLEKKHGVEQLRIYERSSQLNSMKSTREQFARYQEVLGKSLGPSSYNEFVKVKATAGNKWETMKYQYRTVNRYEVDFGKATPEKIFELDQVAYQTKRSAFNEEGFTGKTRAKIKKLPKSGNAGAMEFEGTQYFAHSKVASLADVNYTSSYPLIPLQDNRVYTYLDLGDGIDRWNDTEAKFFEYLNATISKDYAGEVVMLSERHMCESCLNVMKQFEKDHPNVKISLISGKERYNNGTSRSKGWKHRK